MKHFNRIIIVVPAFKPTSDMLVLTSMLITIYHFQVIVIDDGNDINHYEIFDSLHLDVILLRHEKNKGKGVALKTGFNYILENYQDYLGVITCDADGQHSIYDICRIADRLLSNKDDLVLFLGSRDFSGKIPLRSKIGNQFTRLSYFLASGVKLQDTQTGLRGFSNQLLPIVVNIHGERYEYEMNMLLELANQKIPIKEMLIETIYISNNASSHFRVIKDSIIIYKNILQFSLSSILSFIIDFIALFILQKSMLQLPTEVALLFAVIGARSISSIFNYLFNKYIIFKRANQNSLYKYYFLVVCMLGLNYLSLYILTINLSIPLWIAKLTTEVSLFFLSYIVQRKWVFK